MAAVSQPQLCDVATIVKYIAPVCSCTESCSCLNLSIGQAFVTQCTTYTQNFGFRRSLAHRVTSLLACAASAVVQCSTGEGHRCGCSLARSRSSSSLAQVAAQLHAGTSSLPCGQRHRILWPGLEARSSADQGRRLVPISTAMLAHAAVPSTRVHAAPCTVCVYTVCVCIHTVYVYTHTHTHTVGASS